MTERVCEHLGCEKPYRCKGLCETHYQRKRWRQRPKKERKLLDTPRQVAKSIGLTRYRTGKPCINGHVAERLVSNFTCLECHREERISRNIRTENAESHDACPKCGNPKKKESSQCKPCFIEGVKVGSKAICPSCGSKKNNHAEMCQSCRNLLRAELKRKRAEEKKKSKKPRKLRIRLTLTPEEIEEKKIRERQRNRIRDRIRRSAGYWKKLRKKPHIRNMHNESNHKRNARKKNQLGKVSRGIRRKTV